MDGNFSGLPNRNLKCRYQSVYYGDSYNQVMSNVTPASGFFSNAVYTLLSIVMLAVYTTAALLLIIFIHTKKKPQIQAASGSQRLPE